MGINVCQKFGPEQKEAVKRICKGDTGPLPLKMPPCAKSVSEGNEGKSLSPKYMNQRQVVESGMCDRIKE